MIVKALGWIFYSVGGYAFIVMWLGRLAWIDIGNIKEVGALVISGVVAITGAIKVIPGAFSRFIKLYFYFQQKLEEKRKNKTKNNQT